MKYVLMKSLPCRALQRPAMPRPARPRIAMPRPVMLVIEFYIQDDVINRLRGFFNTGFGC